MLYRFLKASLITIILFLLSFSHAFAYGSIVDPTFDPGTGLGVITDNSKYYSPIAIQGDGKIVVGGTFPVYNGTTQNNIVRVNSDGSLDSGFNPGTGPNNTVSGISVQSDGKIVIVGSFTSYNGTARNYIARINSDGTLDTGFDPGTGFNTPTNAVAIRSDGEIIVSGGFTSYNGVTKTRVARINTDGTLDTSFTPPTWLNNTVSALALQADGKVLIGGDFYNYNAGTNKYTYSRFARLNTDGTIDTGFHAELVQPVDPDGAVYAIAIQSDNQILIGGNFTFYNGTTRGRIARVNYTDGTIDTSFDPGTGANSYVTSITPQSSGKMIVSGYFSGFNGASRGGIVRLNANGTIDTSFDLGVGANSYILKNAIQSDGKIIITGVFSTFDGTTRKGIARLDVTPHTLSYAAGVHGSLTGTTSQTVLYGSDGTTVTAVPDSTYSFLDWSDASTQNPRTDTNVTGDISVTANFTLSPIATYTAGAHGTLTGTTTQTITYRGSGTTVTAVPATGYHFVDWSDASTQNPRTDTNVTGDINVTANFAINTYSLVYTAGAGGSITGTTSQSVTYGSNGTVVTAVPATHYTFLRWSDASTQNPRTDTNVTSSNTFTALFQGDAYTLIYTAGPHGSLSGTSPQTVAYGSYGGAIYPIADSGYQFTNWSDASTANPRQDLVSGDVNVTANFGVITHSLNYFTDGNGTIPENDVQTVEDGTDGTGVVAVPNPGYVFLYWDDASTDNPRKDLNVTTDLFPTAYFNPTACGLIPVGSTPNAMAQIGTKLYVPNSGNLGDYTVSVINTTNNQILSTIHAGLSVVSSAIVGTNLYLLNQGDNTVSVINTATDTVTGSIALGAGYPISMIAVGTKLYILNQGTSSLLVIDTATNTISGSPIPLGTYPVAMTAVGTKLYVVDQLDGTVTDIDTTTDTAIGGPITVGNSPLAATAVSTNLYVVNQADGTVSVIDTTSDTVVGSPITVGSNTISAVVASGAKLYILNNTGGTVYVINTSDNSVSGPITVGFSPISATAVGTDLYVNNQGESTVSVIDTTNDTVSPITVGAGPTTSVAVGNDLYIADYYENTVAVIDTTTKALIPCQTTYTCAYPSGPHGSVTGHTFQTIVDGGDTTAVTAVPDTGYEFLRWSDNSTQNPRTDTGVHANTVATALFGVPAVTHTLTYTAGAGGSVTGSSPQTVNDGSDGTAVTAVPDTGYSFVNWSDAVTDNPRTDIGVTGDITVYAVFSSNAPATHVLSYTAGTGGTLAGTTTQVVDDGTDGTAVTAIPSSDYAFTRWSDNSIQNPRIDTNVTTDITVSAIFTAILSSGGGSGSIYYICNDPKATNYEQFGTANQSLCKYISKATLGGGNTCPTTQQLTQNLKAPSRNGKYNSFTKGIVKEAKILQGHLNRLGFAAGSIDGILGPKSDGAIKRMQKFLGTKQDGYVGPITRGLLNSSCK